MSTNPNPFGGSGGGIQAWQFQPETYGAKHDKKTATDGAMSSVTLTNQLVCGTSNPFTPADVGKGILVTGAGAAGADIFGTILSYQSPSTVTLSVNASTTISGKGVIWATDDTAAVQSAIAAAITYAQAHGGYGEIVFGSYVYMCNSAPTIGGSTAGNSILTLPPIATNLQKVVLKFTGPALSAGPYAHWQQVNPQYSGAVLQTCRLDGTVDASNWQAFILGSPYNGYGAGTLLFSNMAVIIDGITFAVPFNSTYGGFSAFGLGQARVVSGACLAQGTLPSAGATAWHTLVGGGPTNTSTGLVMPDLNNNNLCDIDHWVGEGIGTVVLSPEHTSFLSIYAEFCGTGIEAFSPGGTAAAHLSVTGKYLSVENCFAGVGNYTGVTSKIQIDVLDEEVTTYIVDDPSSVALGYVGVVANNTPGYNSMPSNLATQMRIIYLQVPPGAPPGSPVPPGPPASGSAWANLYYRDAWVTLSATTITQVKIGTVVQNGLAGSPATYGFMLPSGQSYTPTYTGALTHTVTLF